MISSSAPGKIITFYSYKGGTGRSMALANIAWILASNGKRVLAVDWDLEAPGLHRYFAPFLLDRELTASNGLIDLLGEFVTQASTPTLSPRPAGWHEKLIDLDEYTVRVKWEFATPGLVHMMPAGRQGTTYATRVTGFDWTGFYERFGGGVFLESMRQNMLANYDYVLIDSRTGVSDTAGICTVHMPDALVVLFTPNNQGIDGSAAVASSVERQWSGDEATRDRRIFPVMARLDTSEKDKLDRRRRYARERFDRFLRKRSSSDLDAYWGAVSCPYIPWYSYEEILAPFGDTPGDPKSFLASCEALTAEITGNAVKHLVWPTEADRVRIRDEYTRDRDETYDVFLLYGPANRENVDVIARYLRDTAKLRVWYDVDRLTAGEEIADAVDEAIKGSGAIAILIGEGGPQQVSTRVFPTGKARLIPVLLRGASSKDVPAELGHLQSLDVREGLTPVALYKLECAVRGTKPDPKRIDTLKTAAPRRRFLGGPVRTLILGAVVGIAAIGTVGVFVAPASSVPTGPITCGIPTSNLDQPSTNTSSWCANAPTGRVTCLDKVPGGGTIEGTCIDRQATERWAATSSAGKVIWAGALDSKGQWFGTWEMSVTYRGNKYAATLQVNSGRLETTAINLPTGATVVLTERLGYSVVEATCGSTRYRSSVPNNPINESSFSIDDGTTRYSGELKDHTPTGVWNYAKSDATTVEIDKLSSADRAAWSKLVDELVAAQGDIERCKLAALPAPRCGTASQWVDGQGCQLRLFAPRPEYVGPCRDLASKVVPMLSDEVCHEIATTARHGKQAGAAGVRCTKMCAIK